MFNVTYCYVMLCTEYMYMYIYDKIIYMRLFKFDFRLVEGAEGGGEKKSVVITASAPPPPGHSNRYQYCYNNKNPKEKARCYPFLSYNNITLLFFIK